jgi:hypothetical protein
MVDRPDAAVERLTVTTLEPVGASRGTGARARTITAAWLVMLVGVAGFAVAGRVATPEGTVVAIIAEAPPAVSSTPLPRSAEPSARRVLSSDGKPIVLTSPAEGDPTITAVELIVQGFLQADAASVRVVLETGGAPVGELTVRPALAFGERPSSTRHAQFLVRFGLPDPRPIGSMVVRVIALDRDGQRLAVIRRAFQVGPIDRPTLGDDGILGGLVFSGG